MVAHKTTLRSAAEEDGIPCYNLGEICWKNTAIESSTIWQEMSLQPAEDNAQTHLQQSTQSTSQSQPQARSKPRKSVRFLQALQTQHPTGCLRYIADADRKFLLYPLACSSTQDDTRWSPISLRHILHEKIDSAPPLTPWDRLTLTATVASAVLQLHSSPCLKSTWSNNDVIFLQNKGERLYNQAYVARAVPLLGAPVISPAPVSIFNETLLSLAIIVVELSLGPSEMLQIAEGLRTGICANMVTLWRLVEDDEIGLVFGPRYQSAVKRCIELAKASTSLDEQIQRDVYEGVVQVLEAQAMQKNTAP